MNYDEETRSFYKSDAKAAEYHDWFTRAPGLNGARFRFIAARERGTVARLLARIPHARVIDVPAGTGKMAPVFRDLGCDVLACDVSDNMLGIARRVYSECGVSAAFMVLDLEHATKSVAEPYDVTVCVRLMHRVPVDVKRRMLTEIAALSPRAVVSFAVDSWYERVRGWIRRNTLSRGGDAAEVQRAVLKTWPDRRSLEELLLSTFEIEDRIPVSRMLSSEVMYLLRSKEFRGERAS